MSKVIRLLFLLLLVPIAAIAQNSFPAGVSGEFVSLDLKSGKYFRVNPEGCGTRFAPYSSFKIPNSVIGLETGVVKNPDQKWHWDEAKYPAPNPGPGGDYVTLWRQDNSLRMALANSIVWYYRELATRAHLRILRPPEEVEQGNLRSKKRSCHPESRKWLRWQLLFA